MTDEKKIPASMAGTWLEGTYGIYNGPRAVQRAVEWGWEVPEEVRDMWEAINFDPIDIDAFDEVNGDDGNLVTLATDYLQSIAPDGYVFRWDDGLSLILATADCVADGGGCEWIGDDKETGEPIIVPCDGHVDDDAVGDAGTGHGAYEYRSGH